MLFSNFGNPSSNPAPRVSHQVRDDVGVKQKSHPLEINRFSRGCSPAVAVSGRSKRRSLLDPGGGEGPPRGGGRGFPRRENPPRGAGRGEKRGQDRRRSPWRRR